MKKAKSTKSASGSSPLQESFGLRWDPFSWSPFSWSHFSWSALLKQKGVRGSQNSSSYFHGLNYTLANEDTQFELTLAAHYASKNILTVCGSGGRSLPFLAHNVERLTLVDLSQVQLDLAELKYATLAHLSHEDYLLFWGFPPFLPEENKQVRRSLFKSLPLNDTTRTSMAALFEKHDFEGLIYKGKWEERYTVVPAFLRKILGQDVSSHYDKLFSFEDLKSQKDFVTGALQNPLWKALPKAVVFAFGNAHYFNAMIYRGAMVKKNITDDTYGFYLGAFRRILEQTVARENFFLQLSFYGRVMFAEANTPEAQRATFEGCKSYLKTADTKFLNTPVIPDSSREDPDSVSLRERGPYDFVSLSDVPSYFSGRLETSYLQDLKTVLAPGAIVVVRCYLRIPEMTVTEEFEDISAEWAEQIALEKTQMYKIFVYQYKPRRAKISAGSVSTPNSPSGPSAPDAPRKKP